jgi:hypothetical protein
VAELVRPIRTAAAYEDPTSIAQRNGFQYAPSGGNGGDGV